MIPDNILYTYVVHARNEDTGEWEYLEFACWESGVVTWQRWDGESPLV